MTNCSAEPLSFQSLKQRKIQADFSGGDITSNGGVVLLREIDRRLGLLESVDHVISDPRVPRYIEHSQLSMLRQRIYGLCLGYDDLNDHHQLRHDAAIQTSVNRDNTLASQSTLCRLENRIHKSYLMKVQEILVNQFIASFASAPEALILDCDATDDPVHGGQENRFFQGYYRHYCFLPLYVFCGDPLLVSYLRPSNIDGAKHSWAILSLLVKKLRSHWPDVAITFRGDSGFCRWKMLRWCDRHDVSYIVGLAKNERLKKHITELAETVKADYESEQRTVRQYCHFMYKAKSWDRQRRVIAKVEHMEKGPNPRFMVTNLLGDNADLYERVYCARGDMENRIKEQQLGLFADRTSCHGWWANQCRLLFSSLAYVLMESLRRQYLTQTVLAKAQVSSLRLKLLKIGGVILRNTRRIRFLLSSHYPYQPLFSRLVQQWVPT